MGRLIVIEGLDGSGKATQTELLYQKLLSRHIAATKVSFPNYEEDTSALVKMYLSGELGTLDQVGAYGASLFYTVDRYGSFLRHWQQDYKEGKTVLCDRYTTSNIAHQMSKLPKKDWDEYLNWLYNLEFERVGLPAPDCVVYLDMHPNTSRKLLANRYHNDDSKKDLHEANFEYLMKCREAALYGAKKLGWKIISCCDGENPYSKEEIADRIEKELTDILLQDDARVVNNVKTTNCFAD